MLLKGSKEEKPIIKSVKFTIAKIVNNTLTVSEDTEQFKDPLEQEMATHSSILAWKIPWMEYLVGCSPWGRRESDTTERLHFHFM